MGHGRKTRPMLRREIHPLPWVSIRPGQAFRAFGQKTRRNLAQAEPGIVDETVETTKVHQRHCAVLCAISQAPDVRHEADNPFREKPPRAARVHAWCGL
jgi:hypothetical protein